MAIAIGTTSSPRHQLYHRNMNEAEKLLVDVGLTCFARRIYCSSMVTQFCLHTAPLLGSNVDGVVEERKVEEVRSGSQEMHESRASLAASLALMQSVSRGNRTLPEEEGSEEEDRNAAKVPPSNKLEVLPPVDVAHALHRSHSHYSCDLHQ